MYSKEPRLVSIAINLTKMVSPSESGKQSWKRKDSIVKNDGMKWFRVHKTSLGTNKFAE